MAVNKKLRWMRTPDGYDLICIDYKKIDSAKLEELLQYIERDYDDFKKPFSQKASNLWREWIKITFLPLKEEALCLLSNWFLGEGPAQTCERAKYAKALWNELFCDVPDRRLTNWKESEEKVFYKDVFERWWDKQLKSKKQG